MEQPKTISESEKVETRELIEKYRQNSEKLQKINRAAKQLRVEQNEIKEKIKTFMRRKAIRHIYTQDGGKIVYQTQMVQIPLNKKYFEKRVVELLGTTEGKTLMERVLANRERTQREHVTMRIGSKGSQVYV